MRLSPVVLEGPTVRLEPLEARHVDAVVAVVHAHPEVWAHIPYVMRERADVERRFAQAEELLKAGTALTFATCAGTPRRLVGSTRISVTDPETPTIEIGSTWIAPEFQRTSVNTEAKYLQLTHCFEALGIARVELKADALNARSRAAIARIGAKEEGTLRHHMRRPNGTMRDSVYFSILAEEWPDVKRRLEERMARSGAGGA
jgi:RimJ/RimL family protein N-acetyltransferase